MKILKEEGYEVITFKDLEDNKFKKRFDKNKKQIMKPVLLLLIP